MAYYRIGNIAAINLEKIVAVFKRTVNGNDPALSFLLENNEQMYSQPFELQSDRDREFDRMTALLLNKNEDEKEHVVE